MGKCLDRSGLHARASACNNRAGSNQVAKLTTLAAQAFCSTALAFMKGKWASRTVGSIQIHGDVLGGRRGWPKETRGRGRGLSGLAGRKGKTRLLLVPREDRCSLVLLNRNGCTHVLRKPRRYGTLGRNFKPNVFFQFF